MTAAAAQGVSFNAASSRFAQLVSRGTGLSLPVVFAWIQAERGPVDNPLNMMPGGVVAHYGTPDAAANATVANLRGATYTAVLGSAGQSDAAQLDAIANSKWDAGRYTGGAHAPAPGVPIGTRLFGAYAAVRNTATSGGSRWSWHNLGVALRSTPAGLLLGPIAPAVDAASLAAGNVSDVLNAPSKLSKWAAGEAPKVGVYVVLVIVGIALVIYGLLDTLGFSPRSAGQAIATGRATSLAGRVAKTDIPF